MLWVRVGETNRGLPVASSRAAFTLAGVLGRRPSLRFSFP
eukprot:CAMPEP_0181271532 /NCGR_PEP_ID=MMETSP1097-20121128/7454_1 /TAXON_ID=35684 /ORGANISM="Pseudopedinella elastica, Strain CCMP716" /LENGTH=39 /DNA_ID= /DNA_START= /DNA_END= /DNA_ORIENTATION=